MYEVSHHIIHTCTKQLWYQNKRPCLMIEIKIYSFYFSKSLYTHVTCKLKLQTYYIRTYVYVQSRSSFTHPDLSLSLSLSHNISLNLITSSTQHVNEMMIHREISVHISTLFHAIHDVILTMGQYSTVFIYVNLVTPSTSAYRSITCNFSACL